MGILADGAAACVAAVAGVVVGMVSAFFYIVLELPVRTYDALGAGLDGCTKGSGWALTLGMTAASLASGLNLSLRLPAVTGHALYALTLLCGGAFTGMIAAGLSEVLDVLPHTIFTLHIRRMVRPLLYAVLIGKTVGAALAIFLQI